jgi:hypothetical protein
MFNDKTQRPSEQRNKQDQLKIDAPDSVHEKEAEAYATKMGRHGFVGASGETNPGQIGAAATTNAGFVAPDGVKEAIESTRGSGDILPDNVKRTIKGHGIDSGAVNIHTGRTADQLSKAVGASAFTYGNDIYFAQGKFDARSSEGKHLLAHELSHVMQNSKWSRPVIQRKPVPTDFGEFKDEIYQPLTEKGKTGVEMKLVFAPNAKVNSKKIGLVQAVNKKYNNQTIAAHPNEKVTTGGYRIDRVPTKNNPVLGAADVADQTKISQTADSGTKVGTAHSTTNTYELGKRTSDTDKRNAWLYDKPYVSTPKTIDSQMLFETAAVALDTGKYLGSVTWGWTMSGGAFTKKDMLQGSKTSATKNFSDAATLWNNSKTVGTLTVTPSAGYQSAQVYDGTNFQPLFSLAKGVKVTYVDSGVVQTGPKSLETMCIVSIPADKVPKAHQFKKYAVLKSELTDNNDGKATVDLPKI